MRILNTLFLFLICFSNHAQKKNVFVSSWQENESLEFSILHNGYSHNKKSKIYYTVSNNNKNVFIDLKIENKEIQSIILKHGLVVWIDMSNSLTKTIGVRFPIGSFFPEAGKKSGFSEYNIKGGTESENPVLNASMIELLGIHSQMLLLKNTNPCWRFHKWKLVKSQMEVSKVTNRYHMITNWITRLKYHILKLLII